MRNNVFRRIGRRVRQIMFVFIIFYVFILQIILEKFDNIADLLSDNQFDIHRLKTNINELLKELKTQYLNMTNFECFRGDDKVELEREKNVTVGQGIIFSLEQPLSNLVNQLNVISKSINL